MRKWTILLVLLSLLAVPMVHAQEATPEYTPIFEFTEVYTVQDLGIEFGYPAGYLTDASDGIRVAANEADMAAGLDDDDATQAEGYTFNLIAFPAADVLPLLNLTEEATLGEIAAALAKANNVIVNETVDLPVMTYSAVAIIGTNEQGNDGVAAFWLMDQYLVLADVGVANGQPMDQNVLFSIGQWLGTFRHTVPGGEPELFTSTKLGGFTLPYAPGWTTGLTTNGDEYIIQSADDLNVLENEEDLPLTGSVVTITSFALTDIGLTAKATPQEILDLLLQTSDEVVDPSKPADRILFDQPAVSIEFADGAGNRLTAVIGILGEEAYIIIAGSPDEASFAAFKPIFSRMLEEIQLVAAE